MIDHPDINCLLPTAKEMQDKTQQAIDEAYNHHMRVVAAELRNLSEEMAKAAKQKECSIRIQMQLNKETCDLLKSKGFWISEIIKNTPEGIPMLEISWEEQNGE